LFRSREIKSQANLTEGRHDLARRVFHGKKGEVTKAYYDGMEDQLSARSFPNTMRTPTSTSRVCPTRTPPLDRPRPIRPDERPGVSGFTDQKSSATSSVPVAPRHPRKD
jgi:hypothetical protein